MRIHLSKAAIKACAEGGQWQHASKPKPGFGPMVHWYETSETPRVSSYYAGVDFDIEMSGFHRMLNHIIFYHQLVAMHCTSCCFCVASFLPLQIKRVQYV